MKRKNVVSKLIASLSLVSLLVTGVPFSVMAEEAVSVSADAKTVDILATHDLHSHLDSFPVNSNGQREMVGGFARLKTVIDEKKAENPHTLVVDAGDFSMGTLYQVLFETKAAELSMLGKLGFDATTLGNHEFDYGSEALANMFHAAANSGNDLAEMLVCNIDWSVEQGDSELVREAFEEYGGKEYTVVQKGDVAIALIGVFGEDSLDCSPTAELTFLDPVESVKETVQEIQANEDVDMIVCLSHSGTNADESKSEDEILAKAVPELDVIISGHTHTYLAEPIVHGETYIVSVGEYGQWVGSLSLTQKENGRWNLDSYETIHLDDSIAANEEIAQELATYTEQINEEYLQLFGYEKEQVLAYNPYEFESVSDTHVLHEEMRLGNFMADATKYSIETYGDDPTPVAVTIVPSGVIRETLLPGEVTVSNVFDMFSLGKGADGRIGYPLVSIYLTGAELKTIAEVDASVSDLMTAARLYMSGMEFSYNPNRIILNKVTDAYLVEDGERVEIEDDKLYRVVADMYSGQMLGNVTAVSKGLLSVVPKDKDGNPVDNLWEHLVYADGQELKAWQTIALYAESFEQVDGVNQISEYYSTTHDRKVVDDSKNIVNLVKNPNKFAVIIVAVVLVAIVIVILLIRGIFKISKKVYRRLTVQKANN